MVFSRSLALGFSSVLIALVAAACGDSTTSPNGDTNTGNGTGNTPTKPFENPVDGGVDSSTPEVPVDAADANTPVEAATDAGADTQVPVTDASTSVPDASDPIVIALNDPNRASRAFECRGADLGSGDMRVLFERGAADMDFGAPGLFNRGLDRGDLAVTLREQTCTSPSACGAWSETPTAAPIGLNVHITSVGEQRITIVDAANGARPLVSATLVEPDQILQYSQQGRPRTVRVRFTRELDGRNCLSVAGPSLTDSDANGSRTTRFEVARVYFADASRPSSQANDPAPAQDARYVCSGAAASASELASAWLPGDAPTATFAGRPRMRFVSTRTCHAATGCTAWAAGSANAIELLGVSRATAPFAVVANLPAAGQAFGQPTELIPNVSAFGGAFGNATVEGIVSPTCVSLVAHTFEGIVGSPDNYAHNVIADRIDAN